MQKHPKNDDPPPPNPTNKPDPRTNLYQNTQVLYFLNSLTQLTFEKILDHEKHTLYHSWKFLPSFFSLWNFKACINFQQVHLSRDSHPSINKKPFAWQSPLQRESSTCNVISLIVYVIGLLLHYFLKKLFNVDARFLFFFSWMAATTEWVYITTRDSYQWDSQHRSPLACFYSAEMHYFLRTTIFIRVL